MNYGAPDYAKRDASLPASSSHRRFLRKTRHRHVLKLVIRPLTRKPKQTDIDVCANEATYTGEGSWGNASSPLNPAIDLDVGT